MCRNERGVVIVKASRSGDQTSDMTLLLFGPRYDRELLTYTQEVDKAHAVVSRYSLSLFIIIYSYSFNGWRRGVTVECRTRDQEVADSSLNRAIWP